VRALSRTEVEWVNFFRRYAYRGLGIATIFAVFLGATILYASHEVVAARMSVGDFVLVNTYMLQVVRPMEMLGYALQGLSQGIAMLEKMLMLLREMPEPQLADDRIPPAGAGKLEFEDVTLSYRPECPVLSGVSFKIAAGKTLGIVGASGSGKSSIVRLLVRLLEPDHGRILLDGLLSRRSPCPDCVNRSLWCLRIRSFFTILSATTSLSARHSAPRKKLSARRALLTCTTSS